jgi:hypothetical protein
MKKFPTKLGDDQVTGDAVLGALDFKGFSWIDIFIRESIQNSLDAAIDSNGGLNPRPVKIDYSVQKFNVQAVNTLLGIEFPTKGHENQALVVSDTGTLGLDGPSNQEDESLPEGNFIRLVRSQFNAQVATNAGGGWGMGKAVHFHMGAGLVFLYSRFKNEKNQYKSRFAALLVEKKRTGILKSATGICRWGDDQRKFEPIEDEAAIKSIIKKIGFADRLYSGEETGTTIIIPGLKSFKSWFRCENQKGFEEQMKTSTIRWYGLRLGNNNWRIPDGEADVTTKARLPALNVTLNQKLIVQNLPIWFQIVKKMHPSSLMVEEGGMKERRIHVVNTKGSKDVGILRYKICSREELHGQSISEAMRFERIPEDAKGVLLLTRRLGMIVSYELPGTKAKAWMPSNLKLSENEFLLGVFTPCSDTELKPLSESGNDLPDTIEAYLRKSEGPKHASWIDPMEYQSSLKPYVSLIRKKAYSEFFNLSQTETFSDERQPADSIARTLAQFLPPFDFGNRPGNQRVYRDTGGRTNGGGDGGSGSRKKKPSIISTESSYIKEGMILKLGLYLPNKVSLLRISIKTTSGSFDNSKKADGDSFNQNAYRIGLINNKKVVLSYEDAEIKYTVEEDGTMKITNKTEKKREFNCLLFLRREIPGYVPTVGIEKLAD